MKVKPATQAQADALQRALRSLRDARYCLMFADCPQAADATRRALKSAEGAERHMLRRLQATRAENERLFPNLYNAKTDARIAELQRAARAPEITSGPPRAMFIPPMQVKP